MSASSTSVSESTVTGASSTGSASGVAVVYVKSTKTGIVVYGLLVLVSAMGMLL